MDIKLVSLPKRVNQRPSVSLIQLPNDPALFKALENVYEISLDALSYAWGCAEGATRDFSREKNVLNRYIFGFPLGKHSPLIPLSVKLRHLGNKNLRKF